MTYTSGTLPAWMETPRTSSPLVWGDVYLLHFAAPISDQHTTQHYIGFALDLEARLDEHERGRGARLTQVARERGIVFQVAATWKGDRALERALKNLHNAPLLCPVCCAQAGRKVWAPPIVRQYQAELDPDWDFGMVPAPHLLRMDWYEARFRTRHHRYTGPETAPAAPECTEHDHAYI